MMRLLLLSIVALIGYVSAQETTTAPPPYSNVWRVDDGTGTPCILFDANTTVAVKYLKTDKSRSDWINVAVPASASVDKEDSSCHFFDTTNNVTAQVLRVTFTPDDAAGQNWLLSFYFTNDGKMNGGKAFGLYKVDLNASYVGHTQFNNSVPEEFFDGTTKLSGALGASSNHASKCSIGDIQFNDNAKVHLDSYLVQAYGNSTDFFAPELCDHDVRTSDIVPIVVGACLAGLVIIVLVAYLIGRARAKRQGYASV